MLQIIAYIIISIDLDKGRIFVRSSTTTTVITAGFKRTISVMVTNVKATPTVQARLKSLIIITGVPTASGALLAFITISVLLLTLLFCRKNSK